MINATENIAHKAFSAETLYADAVSLLRQLISTESFSKQEDKTAQIIEGFLRERGVETHRKLNNIWANNKYFDPQKPSILLNSHHDTVKPGAGWSLDPFTPTVIDGKLIGLGSNDAGGCLVSLMSAFMHFYEERDMEYNLVLATTAEEEISGKNGLELILPELGELAFGIVGEPTEMHMAVAEKGLLVLDCYAKGKTGHAARNEGENALYKAIEDINWFRTFRFPKVSQYLGDINMNVTVINAGSQHNVVPAECHFVADIRVTDAYSHQELLEIIGQNIKSETKARSTRLKPSSIPIEHPFIQAGLEIGRKTFGSATTSDQALLDIPSVKMGPGNSSRSHTPDEFIYLSEIREGINIYISLLQKILQPQQAN